MKVVKSISLDETTAPLANAKINFSAWVRQKLLDEVATTRRKAPGTPDHIQPTRAKSGQLCWPFHSDGCCHLCWPDGPPTEADYSSWVASGTYTMHEAPKIQDDPPEGQGWLSDEEEALLLASQEQNDPSTPPLRRRYVRRFLSWCWEWV